jgi:hypothetical protein
MVSAVMPPLAALRGGGEGFLAVHVGRPKIRSEPIGAHANQREPVQFTALAMKREAEALDEQRLEHHEDLLSRRLRRGLGLDGVASLARPPRRVHQLVALKPVGNGDQRARQQVLRPHTAVGHEPQAAAVTERRALLDRRHVERRLCHDQRRGEDQRRRQP